MQAAAAVSVLSAFHKLSEIYGLGHHVSSGPRCRIQSHLPLTYSFAVRRNCSWNHAGRTSFYGN